MSNIKKSAAVPFVNQKGERSMKRVKVERYVAGKRPAYAKDEDEEYYTTDDEDEDTGDESAEEQEGISEEDDEEDVDERLRKPVKIEQLRYRQDSSAHADTNCDNSSRLPTASSPIDSAPNDDDDDDEDEDDDPRFRRLKQLESKSDTTHLLQVQTTSRALQKVEENPIVFDDEDDEEIKERHALARSRTLEELIETKASLGHFQDQQAIDDLIESEEVTYGRDATEDILDKIVITRIDPEEESRKAAALIEEQSKLFIEQAKQESTLVAQVHQKIKDDNQRELEIEAKRKADLGGIDIDSVRTDDEDEDIAYEEWKLREIKRVLRDRSERAKAKA